MEEVQVSFLQISHKSSLSMSWMPSLINIVHAQSVDAKVNSVIGKIVSNIVYPIITVMFALAFVMFVWGVLNFFRSGDDPAAREQGQKHLLWGIVGMAIMVSVFGIIRLVASSVGQSSALGF